VHDVREAVDAVKLHLALQQECSGGSAAW
jgi:hypothetical protein